MKRKMFAFLVLVVFLPALVSAQEDEPDYWDDWFWEAEELVVTERRLPRLQEGPVAVEVITAEEIQNSTAVTLTDVLADYGLAVGSTRGGDNRVVMQGVEGGNVTFLVNGRRVTGHQGGNLVEATLPLSNVERIEVIRGPQSVRHGTAVGGVVNIITREPEDRVSFTASFTNRFLMPHDDPDTDNTPVAGFDPAREQNLNLVLGFPVGRSRNTVDVEGSRGSFHFAENGIASILPRYLRGRVGFDSALPLTDNVDLRYGVSAMFLRREDQTAVARGTGANPPARYGSANQINRRDYMRVDANIGMNWSVSDTVELSFGVSNSYYERDFDRFVFATGEWGAQTAFASENRTDLEVTGSWLFRHNLRFTGGIEGGIQIVDSERFPGDTIIWQDYELFLEAEHFVNGRYSVALGVRAMHNSEFGAMAVPRISGTLHLGRGFRLLAGGGMGYRVPDFNMLFSTITDPPQPNIGYGGPARGNKNLRPETSVGANLGVEWRGTRSFIHANFFHTELWDQIGVPSITNPAPGQDGHIPYIIPANPTAAAPWGRHRTWINLNRTLRTGVDAEARVNLPLHLFVTAGYSWVFAYDREAGREITLSPPHTVRARLGIDLPSPNITAHVNFRWNAGFTSYGLNPPFTESLSPDGTPIAVPSTLSDFESVFNMGLFAAWSINQNWRITFGVDNLIGGTNFGSNHRQTFSIGTVFTH